MWWLWLLAAALFVVLAVVVSRRRHPSGPGRRHGDPSAPVDVDHAAGLYSRQAHHGDGTGR